MRFSLLGLLLALPFFAGALGMLDDFESDVEFLDKSYSDLKKNGLKSNFRDEYRARITVVSDRAFRLQHSADKLGIPEVRIQELTRKLIDSIQIRGIGTRGLGKSDGSVGEYAGKLRSQIKYLRSLNYSYESGTFENPYPSSGTYEAILHYGNMFRQIYQDAIRSNRLRKEIEARYEERAANFRKLGQEIARKVSLERVKVPSDFDLTGYANAYLEQARKLFAMRAKRDNADIRKLVKSKAYKDAQSSLEYAATRLEADIDFLKRINFAMRVRRTDLRPVYRGSGNDAPDEIDGRKPSLSDSDLWKLYMKTKNDFYRSDDKLSGVSEEFYRKYRSMLPASLARELDAQLKRNLSDEIPPAFARSMAVKKLHTKYQYKPDAFPRAELERILRSLGALE